MITTDQLREFAANSEYSHGDYADTMRQAADTIDHLRAEVREWLCAGCNTVYPGPPQAGLACVMCPSCGGAAGPRQFMENRKQQADLFALLPGSHYMDPPDGGSPTLLEQLQRMAKDAARYRWLRELNGHLECVMFEFRGNTSLQLDSYVDKQRSTTPAHMVKP